MWHLHPGLPASCRSQAGVSRAALTSRKICAEIHSTGPGENKPSRASPGLGATLLVSLQGPTEHLLLPRLLILHPSPWLFLTNLLYHLASLNSFPAPGFHCCPRFCSLLPWSSIPIAPPHLLSPYGLRDLERCSPGTPCSITHLGKDHFPCDGEGTHLMIYATSLHRFPLHPSAPDSQQSSHFLSLCPVSTGFSTV